MNIVAVKISRTVVTQQYGTLGPGDVLRTSPEFARHLINDCEAATFIDAPPAVQETPAQSRRRVRKS